MLNICRWLKNPYMLHLHKWQSQAENNTILEIEKHDQS